MGITWLPFGVVCWNVMPWFLFEKYLLRKLWYRIKKTHFRMENNTFLQPDSRSTKVCSLGILISCNGLRQQSCSFRKCLKWKQLWTTLFFLDTSALWTCSVVCSSSTRPFKMALRRYRVCLLWLEGQFIAHYRSFNKSDRKPFIISVVRVTVTSECRYLYRRLSSLSIQVTGKHRIIFVDVQTI